MLEYDDHRSGSFSVLKDLPDDKFVILGLVSSKNPRLETVGELRRRIAEAGGYVDLQRLGLSAQCGFASSVIGNRISPPRQKQKLELVVAAARALWH